VRAAGAITLGVEEEFVLLDPSTGATVLAGPDLVRMLDGEPGVQQELMRFQVETGTRVCTGLDDVGRELIRLRRLAAAAAARLGCRLVASGVAPYRTPGLAAVTDQPRYQELARRYGPVVADAGTCACHVHVGVPSRDLGVQVLARLRPWLAPLLAVTANSPIADGHDTGWASWRYLLWSRWPGDDRDTCETGHGLMLMPPIRGLTCGWLPQWSVVRWLSASALSCSVGKLYCRVVSRRECPMSSATTTRSVLPRKLVESNVPTLSSTSAGAGELGIIPHGW